MLERDFDEIPDLYFRIQMLISDPPYMASRLGFDCTPKGTFLGLHVSGKRVSFLPGVFALPAGIGDVLTGLFAVPAAIAVATGTAQGRRAAMIWNIFGLADFAVAITLGMVTSPGRFQLIVPNLPSIGAGAYPNVLTPAFVVPSSILLHALSLRQLRRRRPREFG
jgi:hypothetical protein